MSTVLHRSVRKSKWIESSETEKCHGKHTKLSPELVWVHDLNQGNRAVQTCVESRNFQCRKIKFVRRSKAMTSREAFKTLTRITWVCIPNHRIETGCNRVRAVLTGAKSTKFTVRTLSNCTIEDVNSKIRKLFQYFKTVGLLKRRLCSNVY